MIEKAEHDRIRVSLEQSGKANLGVNAPVNYREQRMARPDSRHETTIGSPEQTSRKPFSSSEAPAATKRSITRRSFIGTTSTLVASAVLGIKLGQPERALSSSDLNLDSRILQNENSAEVLNVITQKSYLIGNNPFTGERTNVKLPTLEELQAAEIQGKYAVDRLARKYNVQKPLISDGIQTNSEVENPSRRALLPFLGNRGGLETPKTAVPPTQTPRPTEIPPTPTRVPPSPTPTELPPTPTPEIVRNPEVILSANSPIYSTPREYGAWEEAGSIASRLNLVDTANLKDTTQIHARVIEKSPFGHLHIKFEDGREPYEGWINEDQIYGNIDLSNVPICEEFTEKIGVNRQIILDRDNTGTGLFDVWKEVTDQKPGLFKLRATITPHSQIHQAGFTKVIHGYENGTNKDAITLGLYIIIENGNVVIKSGTFNDNYVEATHYSSPANKDNEGNYILSVDLHQNQNGTITFTNIENGDTESFIPLYAEYLKNTFTRWEVLNFRTKNAKAAIEPTEISHEFTDTRSKNLDIFEKDSLKINDQDKQRVGIPASTLIYSAMNTEIMLQNFGYITLEENGKSGMISQYIHNRENGKPSLNTFYDRIDRLHQAAPNARIIHDIDFANPAERVDLEEYKNTLLEIFTRNHSIMGNEVSLYNLIDASGRIDHQHTVEYRSPSQKLEEIADFLNVMRGKGLKGKLMLPEGTKLNGTSADKIRGAMERLSEAMGCQISDIFSKVSIDVQSAAPSKTEYEVFVQKLGLEVETRNVIYDTVYYGEEKTTASNFVNTQLNATSNASVTLDHTSRIANDSRAPEWFALTEQPDRIDKEFGAIPYNSEISPQNFWRVLRELFYDRQRRFVTE